MHGFPHWVHPSEVAGTSTSAKPLGIPGQVALNHSQNLRSRSRVLPLRGRLPLRLSEVTYHGTVYSSRSIVN